MAYFHCLIGGGSSGGGYELTVTCDSAFSGTTITCTDGVTTLTQTCPSSSPYEVVFEIPNGGDWTISGVVSGQTVTTGVSIPTTATLVAYVQKTITIYSAKEDTVTYTDVYGDTQTEVFANDQTSKQITVDIEPNGSSITFTSGVAKDPTNLSNAYSKTVTITSNTTDVKLMPENTLYWWGYSATQATASNYRPSWTGISFVAPTINNNTNDISITQGGNYGSTFFNTPEITSGDITVNVVAKSSSSTGDNIFQITSAYQNSYPYLSGTNVMLHDTTMTKYSQSYNGTSSRVIPVFQSNNSTVYIYALWYE